MNRYQVRTQLTVVVAAVVVVVEMANPCSCEIVAENCFGIAAPY